MPLTEFRPFDRRTALGQWALRESEAELLAEAPAWLFAAGGIPPHLTHTRRRREWLAGRQLAATLLQEMLSDGHTYPIVPDEFGRPRLPGLDGAISLTHGANGVAALVALGAGRRVGLDLEPARPKTLVLAPRFLTAAELAAVGPAVERAALAWSLKESLYKAYGRRQLDFRQHLHLDLRQWPTAPLSLPPQGTVPGLITHPTTGRQWPHMLYYEANPEGWLTYCVGGADQ